MMVMSDMRDFRPSNESYAKHRYLRVIKPERVSWNNLFPSTMVSGCDPFSIDLYYLTSDNEKFLTAILVAELTHR
jgi:hypothetical protein